jgi:serine/threonine-protein kinase
MEIPACLERVILQCLEKDPAARPGNAMELSQLLAACRPAEPWTQERAAQWWRAHIPKAADPARVRTAAVL